MLQVAWLRSDPKRAFLRRGAPLDAPNAGGLFGGCSAGLFLQILEGPVSPKAQLLENDRLQETQSEIALLRAANKGFLQY